MVLDEPSLKDGPESRITFCLQETTVWMCTCIEFLSEFVKTMQILSTSGDSAQQLEKTEAKIGAQIALENKQIRLQKFGRDCEEFMLAAQFAVCLIAWDMDVSYIEIRCSRHKGPECSMRRNVLSGLPGLSAQGSGSINSTTPILRKMMPTSGYYGMSRNPTVGWSTLSPRNVLPIFRNINLQRGFRTKTKTKSKTEQKTEKKATVTVTEGSVALPKHTLVTVTVKLVAFKLSLHPKKS
ncbi:hypothetical protein B0H13DRAFT_1900302 [Mycena leptocephala]|nr:hypothetical protein B0H13DRAFT_1900302 [Mycena leptocephala]